MKAYISVSFKMRNDLDNEIQTIKSVLIDHKIIPFVFVDEYQFKFEEEQMMMQTAINEIDQSDILIAETSDKGIGIGIEAGYAKAKNKFVIYLRNENCEHSTTLSGISDFQVIYTDSHDLQIKLLEVLKSIKPS